MDMGFQISVIIHYLTNFLKYCMESFVFVRTSKYNLNQTIFTCNYNYIKLVLLLNVFLLKNVFNK